MPRGGCSEDESLPVESRGTERSFVLSERSKIIMAQIDPNNPTYAKLSRYAARVETLLKKAAVKGKPGLVASLDDFLGTRCSRRVAGFAGSRDYLEFLLIIFSFARSMLFSAGAWRKSTETKH